MNVCEREREQLRQRIRDTYRENDKMCVSDRKRGKGVGKWKNEKGRLNDIWKWHQKLPEAYSNS